MAQCPPNPPQCEVGKRPNCIPRPDGTGYWMCLSDIPGTGQPPPGICPNGQHWDQLVRACVPDSIPPPPPEPDPVDADCPPGWHHGGGHPGNPCKPPSDTAPPTSGGTTTITELLKRFYTPNWDEYFLSGQLGAGIPQPTDPLLGLLQNSLFQQAVGRYGIGPQQQWQMNMQTDIPGRQGNAPRALSRMFGQDPGERPEAILGLAGGGAALGYIDPSWMSDWKTTTIPGTPVSATPGVPGVPGATTGNPCGGDTGGCPPGQHRGGCHPGNPCKPDGAVAAPAPVPGPTPTPAPGPTPPPNTGNPCGGAQGCPPGQHRKGCHPGNPCTPDNVMTAQLLGRPTPTLGTSSLGSSPGALLNPGSLVAGLSTRPQFTSQVLRR